MLEAHSGCTRKTKWYTDSLEGIDATVYCFVPFTRNDTV